MTIQHIPVRDLHMHSNCSDGLFDPAPLVEYAAHNGVEELSLTDHDTLVGLQEAQDKARAMGVAFMPGIELTCQFQGRTVHMLGYGFRPPETAADRILATYLEEVKAQDHAWGRAMCRLSCADPLIVRLPGGQERRLFVREEELAWARGTMPSPFHMAVVLARKLAAISGELDIPARHVQYLLFGRLEPERRQESFWPHIRARYAPVMDRYGVAVRTYWWAPRPQEVLLDAAEAIRTILRIGGIPVLAHPAEQELGPAEIEQLADMGIKGVEVYTFKHSDAFIAELETLTAQRGLLTTSGTDFHDPHHRAQVDLGRDRGGQALRKGFSLRQFHALGAYIVGAL